MWLLLTNLFCSCFFLCSVLLACAAGGGWGLSVLEDGPLLSSSVVGVGGVFVWCSAWLVPLNRVGILEERRMWLVSLRCDGAKSTFS